MSLKIKIYIVITALILGIFSYQYAVIHNLKKELHSSSLTISTLKQNELALRDSIAFIPDSIGVLHTFIREKDVLNKSLDEMLKRTQKDYNGAKKKIGLLEADIKIKDKVIDSLRLIVDGPIVVTDSTITIPIVYDSDEMGLKLDGYAFARFNEKTGYIHWNRILVKMPKLKIGLVYDKADSTILAMVEANDTIETFATAMSDELYRLIIDNALPQETWMDRFYVSGEYLYNNKSFINTDVGVNYKNFYISAGKSFDVFDKFSSSVYYKGGYKLTFNKILGYIK